MRALGQILLAAAVAERQEVVCARAAKIPNVPSLLILPLPKMKQKTPNPTGLSLQIILNSLMRCSRIVLCRTAANKLARSNILRAYIYLLALIQASIHHRSHHALIHRRALSRMSFLIFG